MYQRFILIENIENPILIPLKEGTNRDGYIVFAKSNLEKVPKKIKEKFFNNGLYKKLASALNEYNGLFNLHRLVLCLYDNILEYEVHHIGKNPFVNNICNLIMVKRELHIEIDKMPIEEGKVESLNLQNKLKDKLFKPSRNTLSQNPKLIIEILKWRFDLCYPKK